jgi:hypothetical protein
MIWFAHQFQVPYFSLYKNQTIIQLTMVAINKKERQAGGGIMSFRTFGILASVSAMLLGVMGTLRNQDVTGIPTSSLALYHTPGLRRTDNNAAQDNGECRFYLAESAIPHGGIGMFAATGVISGGAVGNVDICLYVADTPHGTHLDSHTWGRGKFFGQYEGSHSRAACEGYATLYNTAPVSAINTKLVSLREPTNAGLDRKTHPGAGAISQFYGIHSEAVDHIPAGGELTIHYGDWDFDDPQSYMKPSHKPEWLRKNGFCIDNIEIQPATDPQMGRGAFAIRSLPKGTVVAPAPLQIFKNRADFTKKGREALFVNYCFQPKNSDMLLFPYGPAVNLINHGGAKANVAMRWSQHKLHHSTWLYLPQKELFETATPGGLVLEVVALRDIQANEELFFDYGKDWEDAWKTHVQNWQPTVGDGYVYPADMDETGIVRTLEEQKTQPYPSNIGTVCQTPDWHREEYGAITWYEPEWKWPSGNVWCNILDRKQGDHGDYFYTVEVMWTHKPKYDPNTKNKDRYIDLKVPRRAIRFVDLPYKGDEHLPGVFRHPLLFPEVLFPQTWSQERL